LRRFTKCIRMSGISRHFYKKSQEKKGEKDGNEKSEKGVDKNGNETGTITTTEANKGDKVKGESVKVVKTTAEKKSPKTGN